MRVALTGMLLLLWVAAAAGIALAGKLETQPQDPKAAGKGFLTIEDGRFCRYGEPFSIRTSCADPAVGHWFKFRGPWLETAIESCKAYGFNALSTWITGTGEDESQAVYQAWRQDPKAFFRELDEVLVNRCKAEGLFLVLMFACPFPSQDAPGDYLDTSSDAYRLYAAFARDVCGHYKSEPSILFWEVAGEGPEGRAAQEMDKVIGFYERITHDIRSVDPNHLLSSGTANPIRGGAPTWQAINSIAGIDISTVHVYKCDSWTQNWETERDFVRIVREMMATAHRLGKPVYFGEVGVEPRAKPPSGRYENPGLIWYLKALSAQGAQAYGFHWLYPSPTRGVFNLIPEHSPQTAEWVKEFNRQLAAGKEIPKDFGPKTTGHPFLIATGPREREEVFGGPAPKANGQVEVEADYESFGESAPSMRVTWGTDGGTLSLGPYHANDLTDYLEAGATLGFAVRGENGLPRGMRIMVADADGGMGAVELAEPLPSGKPATEWARVSIPMKAFGDKIDWASWVKVGFEFPRGAPGHINLDDIEVVCERR